MKKNEANVKQLSLKEAYEYLMKNQNEIWAAWSNSYKHKAGLLFSFITPLRKINNCPAGSCGCAINIQGSGKNAMDDMGEPLKALTALLQDENVPKSIGEVNSSNLKYILQVQEKADTWFKEKGLRK